MSEFPFRKLKADVSESLMSLAKILWCKRFFVEECKRGLCVDDRSKTDQKKVFKVLRSLHDTLPSDCDGGKGFVHKPGCCSLRWK